MYYVFYRLHPINVGDKLKFSTKNRIHYPSSGKQLTISKASIIKVGNLSIISFQNMSASDSLKLVLPI